MLRRPAAAAVALTLALTAAAQPPEPQPFEAHYSTRIHGVTATGSRQLEPLGEGRWQLRSEARALFLRVAEDSLLQWTPEGYQLLEYRFEHPLGKKRSMDWRLDWAAGTGRERLGGATAALEQPVHDPLSLQLQLQQDACIDPELDRHYQVLNRKGPRVYRVRRLGSERLDTAVGELDTVLLEQRRPGKERHTLLWLAPDWGCLLVQLEHNEPEDKDSQSLTLERATVGGVTVRGKQTP